MLASIEGVEAKQQPRISTRAVKPVVAGLARMGVDTTEMLRDAGVGDEQLACPEGTISHEAMMGIWRRARESSGDDALGIHVGELAPISSFGVHAFSFLSSGSLRAGLQRTCRYQRLIHETTNLSFRETSEGGVLEHSLPGGVAVPRHPAEFLATVWVRFGRLLTGEQWYPTRVRFAHAKPATVIEHERVFGSHVEFGAVGTQLQLGADQLQLANPTADPGVAHALDAHVTELLAAGGSSLSCSERVRAHLTASLRRGEVPSIADVARALKCSQRTLQRQLGDESATFSGLLEGVRLARAVALLSNPDVAIAEVGFLLGYAELGAFYRAFKRWTGKTPTELRAELLAPSS